MKIINIKSLTLNNYIVKYEKGYIVIDTGYPGDFPRFLKKLNSADIALKEIRFVFLTHSHDDHAGFINELAMQTNAQVVLHKQAVERLEMKQRSFNGVCPTKRAQLICKMISLAGKGRYKQPTAGIKDRYIVADGISQQLRDSGIQATVLLLPGHTADSIGLLLDDGSLFCGDAAMNGFPSKARHPLWIENLLEFKKSWDVMLGHEPSKIYPAHGAPFDVSDLAKYKNYFLEKIMYFHPNG